MTTRAEQDAVLAAELRPVLRPWGLHDEDDLIQDLVEFMSGYAARQVEKHARSPRSQQGPGRSQQPETRRSA